MKAEALAGLEHSGGKTSALLSKKQLFLSTKLGKVIMSFSNNLKFIILKKKQLETFKPNATLTRVDVPEKPSHSQTEQCQRKNTNT